MPGRRSRDRPVPLPSYPARTAHFVAADVRGAHSDAGIRRCLLYLWLHTDRYIQLLVYYNYCALANEIECRHALTKIAYKLDLHYDFDVFLT